MGIAERAGKRISAWFGAGKLNIYRFHYSVPGLHVSLYRTAGFLLACLLSVLPLVANADDNHMMTVTVTVTVVESSCVVNDNKPIEVEFGEVKTSQVDGINYRVPVNYTLKCDQGASNAMKLRVQGTAADFDNQALVTSITGLGIRLQNGTANLPVNSWQNFTYPNKPALWAVPVKQSGVALPGGEFTASATLQVDYQ